MRFLVLIPILALGGCCWLARRDCFPACPPATVVEVEQTCELPPKIVLKPFKSQACQDNMICYDRDNAAALARTIEDMRDWILEVRRRCAPQPTSRPASRPTTP